jgi:hypothetical protein
MPDSVNGMPSKDKHFVIQMEWIKSPLLEFNVQLKWCDWQPDFKSAWQIEACNYPAEYQELLNFMITKNKRRGFFFFFF